MIPQTPAGVTLLNRVQLFTDIEVLTMEAWLDADNAGKEELADKILQTGLLAEHYLSLLDFRVDELQDLTFLELVGGATRTFGLRICPVDRRAFSGNPQFCSFCGRPFQK